MFAKIRAAMVVFVCANILGYSADGTTPSYDNVLTKKSQVTSATEFTSVPGRNSNYPDTIVTNQPNTHRFLQLTSAIQQEMRAFYIPGAAVAVVEGGKITYAAGFGSKHPYYNEPMKPTTLFRIGSVTKTLTAIGLLQLVDQELVNINSPITDYIPDFSFSHDPNWAPSITVRNLLTHTSAIADCFTIDTPGFKDDDALSRYFSGPYNESPYAYIMAPPGRMFNYTNPGYMLAGWVIESVSGISYRQYIQENILTPLGMSRTFFLPEQVLTDGDFAYGSTAHWETGEPFVVEPNSYDNGWARPAGLAFSNVLDLAEVIKFLRAGQPDVLTDSTRMAMQEKQMDMEVFLDLLGYGYGLIIQDGGFYHPTASNFYQLRIITHGGDVPGFSADIYYVPEFDFGFIALTNVSNCHLSYSFSTALVTLCRMPEPVSWPNFSMTSNDYASYSGQYHDPFNVGDIIVKEDTNQLTVDIPVFEAVGQRYDHTLVPSSPNNFILYVYGVSNFDVFPLDVTFIRDESGLTEYFRTRSFVAQHTADIPSGRDSEMIFKQRKTTTLRPILDSIHYLPGPQLHFIKPPGQ